MSETKIYKKKDGGKLKTFNPVMTATEVVKNKPSSRRGCRFRYWRRKQSGRTARFGRWKMGMSYFSFFSSGLLHFSQTLCSLAASAQHLCSHSLALAMALSQQLASFWHFSQVF